MSRNLIDRDRLKKEIHEKDIMGGLNYAWYIDHAELVDAVEVVRCKDCKYYLNDMGHCLNDLINAWMSVNPNWYCANGEVKSEESEE